MNLVKVELSFVLIPPLPLLFLFLQQQNGLCTYTTAPKTGCDYNTFLVIFIPNLSKKCYFFQAFKTYIAFR